MFKKILVLFLVVFTLILSVPFYAFAETSTGSIWKDLTKTSLKDDLSTLDLKQYVKDSNIENPYIVTLAEQGFSTNIDYNKCALYVYIYYPLGNSLYTNGLNKIQLKKGSNFVKYSLSFISKENDTLYKFRVNCDASYFKQLNKTQRIYEIVSIELQTTNGEITDYEIGGKYTFSGFGDETSLTNVETFEVVHLDLNYTTFRNSSQLGLNYKNQLTSVYFSIPQYILDRYDNKLYGIDCTYEKYYTKPMVVTGNQNVRDELKKFNYNSLTAYSNSNGNGFIYYYNSSLPLSLYNIDSEINNTNFEIHTYSFAYNRNLADTMFRDYMVTENFISPSYIPLYFYKNDKMDSDFWISKEEVSKKINELYSTLDFSDSHYTINGLDFYHKILYENYILDIDGTKLPVSVDNSKFNGSITFDDEPYDMLSYSETHSWWDRFLAFGFKSLFVGIKNDVSFKDIAPISEIKSSDVSLGNDEFSTTYFVDKNEVAEVKKDVTKNSLKKEKTFIFRVDVAPYYAFSVKSDINGVTDINNFIVQEPVYMGFDVLDIMFKDKQGEIVKVAVSADPKNLIGGLEADAQHQVKEDYYNLIDRFKEWFEKMFRIILICLLICVIISITPILINFVSSLIDGISRILQGTSNSTKRKRNKRKRNKRNKK